MKMFGKHVQKHLAAYHHGELAADQAHRVEKHLDECNACRAAHEQIRFAARLVSILPRAEAPASIQLRDPKSQIRTPRSFRLALTGVLAILAIFVIRYGTHNLASWEVAVLRGAPVIGTTRVTDKARLRVGQDLRTDADSQARVKIADVGNLDIDANTEIRLIATRADEHRIALNRGKLEAFTWAPPRLFFVETPSAVAIDMGCAYTLEVDDQGGSLLHVTLGLVALQLNGRESMVPAGAFCRTRKGAGPGTPYFDDASDALMQAVERIDFGSAEERDTALNTVLTESRRRDTLTLWHLLPRLNIQQRERVYLHMAELVPPPAAVTREGILALDTRMLDSWREKLTEVW